MNYPKILTLIFLIFLSFNFKSQKEKRRSDILNPTIKHFTESEGLPSTVILWSKIDKKGIMWFGSYNGIFSYDGNEIKTRWNNKKSKGKSVIYIYPGIDKIWYLTFDIIKNKYIIRLEYLDLLTEEFGEINLPNHLKKLDNLPHENLISSIYQENLNILNYTAAGKLYAFNLKEKKLDSLNLKKRSVEIQRDHPIWKNTIPFAFNINDQNIICYDKGLHRFNETENDYQHYPLNMLDSNEYMTTRKKNNDTLLIITSKNNLYSFDLKTNQYSFLLNDSLLVQDKISLTDMEIIDDHLILILNNYLFIDYNIITKEFKRIRIDPSSSNNEQPVISNISKDNNKCIWISSSTKGIFLYDINSQYFKNLKIESQDFPNLNIGNLIEYNNAVYLTTNEGLLKYEIYNDTLYSLEDKINYGNNSNSSINGSLELNQKQEKLYVGNNNFVEYDLKNDTGELLTTLNGYGLTMEIDNNNKLWLSVLYEGFYKFNFKNKKLKKINSLPFSPKKSVINEIKSYNNRLYIASGTSGLFVKDSVSLNFNKISINGIENITGIDIQSKDSIWISSLDSGILCIDHNGKVIDRYKVEITESSLKPSKYNPYKIPTNSVSKLKLDKNNNIWCTSSFGIIHVKPKQKKVFIYDESHGLDNKNLLSTSKEFYINNNDEFLFAIDNQIYKWNPDDFKIDSTLPKIYFNEILFIEEQNNELLKVHNNIYQEFNNNIEVDHVKNSISIKFNAIHYRSIDKIQYAYRLKGIENDWTNSDQRVINYSRLNPGTYTFEVKAANLDGVWCKPISFTFTISPPFWITWWFISICIGLLLLSIYLIISIRTKQLKSRQLQLQETVKERTNELAIKHEESEKNRLLAEVKNKEIIDSINYAKRLQDSILPNEEKIVDLFPESFMLYRPKDIVSGDFYWVKEQNERTIIAAVDCTGHGVPGAFMSFIGANGLNSATDEKQLSDTAKILDHLNESVHKALNKENNLDYIRDGMDLTICSFDLKNLTLQFSGAKNNIYQIRNQELFQHSGDDFAIGSFNPGTKNYNSQNISLEKGDTIYLFSDGYPDQFGGVKGKKFMYKQFKQKLIEFSNLSLNDQKVKLEQTMDAWMASHEQIDDMLVIGIKI